MRDDINNPNPVQDEAPGSVPTQHHHHHHHDGPWDRPGRRSGRGGPRWGGRGPWGDGSPWGGDAAADALRTPARALAGAVRQVAWTGTPDQIARVNALLDVAQRGVYRILAEDPAPAAGGA